MAQQPVRKRFWFASFVGTVGAVLFALTLITPDWIEEVFPVDPDRGNGALEIAIAVGLLALAGASAMFARHEWTRPLTEGARDQ